MRVIIILLVLLFKIDPARISKINSLKSQAKKAYLSGDMKTAIEKYKILRDSLGVKEEEIGLNLGHAFFTTNDTTNAYNSYQPLLASHDQKIKSLANQQMGIIANRQGKYEEALNYFKQAMKAEPANEQARYDYEMVKKKLEEQKKQQQKDQNQDKKDDQKKDQNKDQKDQQKKDSKDQKDKQDKKETQPKEKQDQQKKDQQNKEQKEKEQKEKEQKEKQQKEQQQDKKEQKEDQKKPDPSLQDKLKDMKISEEKAKMILEAMKNQEVQYLQQNKRKASKPKEKGKPDW
ncbi:MAG: hypothetical protein OJF59_002609 [Cytophagales bacterium]|jgi:hypothetical protein|nr:tetratricopeptide repeat protein [Bacteroidota bacterium]MBS1980327.1 tetratricopeptide repeat protein [Bacteroidota bacterium]WHZ08855.1 MAG: hypothetical protein OJF59_002609 [Cytophagales bacterium]